MGLSRPEILQALRRRLTHDQDTEKAVVVQELRRIAALRLARAIEVDREPHS